MAGHSKWANIKHAKARIDAKRGKIFTKHIRAITVAARAGGPDLNSNSNLRLAVDKARADNMTNDTINRAIKRGAGLEEGSNLAEVRYEGYGPNGVAVIVDCLTDNKNRTVAEVRHAFTKHGGNLGTDGSVSYLFTQTGLLNFPAGADEEKIMEVALEHGAEDIETNDDGSINVITTPENYQTVRDAILEAKLTPSSSEITMLPSTEVDMDDQEQAEKLMKLLEMLEDLDDVQEVYSNADFSDEVLKAMS